MNAVVVAGPLAVEPAGSTAPLTILQNAFRRWWLIAVLTIVGAAAGGVYHLFQPPVYEAMLGLSVEVDLVKTGNLTQFEEDMALNSAGELLVSAQVFNQVAERANAEGLLVDYQALKRMILVERNWNRLNLRVQHTDVQLVERVANIWAEVGQAALSDAYAHALQAERLERSMHDIESCLENAVAVAPVQPVCAALSVDQLRQNMTSAGQALVAERTASLGLFSGLRLGPLEAPVVSTNPVRFGLIRLGLASGLIGLLVGVVLAQWDWLIRRIERRGENA